MTSPQARQDLTSRARRLFDVLTYSVPGFVWVADASGNVIFVNQAWLDFTGLSVDESLGLGWFAALHPADAERLRAAWPEYANTYASTHEMHVRFRRTDGLYRWHLVRANPVADDDRHWIGCSTDIHSQVVAQQKDRGQIAILSMVASDAPIRSVLEALCALGEEQVPGSRCTILLLNEGATAFEGGVATFLPEELQARISGTRIGTGVGSCGTAAFEKRDVISADIRKDPLWRDWKEAFEPLGVRACWSLPVSGADGLVLATFGFYFSNERVPSFDELDELEGLRHLASLALGKARTTRALQESEEHHRYTVEHNPQIPWTADAEGRILSVSSRWTEATGLSADAAMGNGWFKALHPDDVKPTADYWAERLRTGEPADLKYRIMLRDGTYRWVRARASPRRDDHGNIIRWYGAVEDIHELELATERLKKQVYVDELTGLLNRRGLEERLQSRRTSSQGNVAPISLMIIDIAGFRHVNDRFGRVTGDAALRLFGRHLCRSLTSEDLVARLAGDEFAIVLPGSPGDLRLKKRAEKLTEDLTHRLGRSAKTRNCAIKIGCASSEPGEKVEDVLRRADLALFAAKKDSLNAVKIFSPAVRRLVDERVEHVDLAKQALKSRWIVPHYQPMVSLATGEVAGAEALLRIDHPLRGILSPASIWQALDAPRISKEISDRMLSLILADLSLWAPWPKALGSISINLSTEMMLQEGLARSILRKIDRRGVAPHQITVEITERVLIDDLPPTAHRSLLDLRSSGVRISLDDFGTGFASLTHLQKMPVDEIKIDQSFIKGLLEDEASAAIVKSMINLGLNLGVDVVAEGVETPEQAKSLRDWGCRFAQGYHFYRPMAANEFGRIFHRSKKPCDQRAGVSIPLSMDPHITRSRMQGPETF